MSTTSNSKSGAGSTETAPTAPTRQWRTVDAVVAAVLGVAFGVVFAGWNAL